MLVKSFKIIDHPEYEKIRIKKKLKKRLNMKFPMLRENRTTFSIIVNKYFLLL